MFIGKRSSLQESHCELTHCRTSIWVVGNLHRWHAHYGSVLMTKYFYLFLGPNVFQKLKIEKNNSEKSYLLSCGHYRWLLVTKHCFFFSRLFFKSENQKVNNLKTERKTSGHYGWLLMTKYFTFFYRFLGHLKQYRYWKRQITAISYLCLTL